MYGCDPKLFHLGTKTGCRRIFAELGINHPIGVEGLTSEDDLVDAIADAPREEALDRPGHREAERGRLRRGERGRRSGRPPTRPCRDEPSVLARIRAMQLEARPRPTTATSRSSSSAEASSKSGSSGDEFRSPSAQLRISPLGEVERLSTHDQLLGGPTGQSYLGCRFPADAVLRRRDHARRGAGGRAPGARRRARPLRARLRRGPPPGREVGDLSRSRSTCARVARPTRS